MHQTGKRVAQLAAVAGVALVVACLLAAQMHAVLHVRASTPECQTCVSSVWTAPAHSLLVETPAQSFLLEVLPELQNAPHGDVRLTAPRAPPLV